MAGSRAAGVRQTALILLREAARASTVSPRAVRTLCRRYHAGTSASHTRRSRCIHNDMAVETPLGEGVLLEKVTKQLAENGITDPVRYARHVIAAAEGDRAAVDVLLARHLSGEPLNLVLGRGEFMGIELFVPRGVLVPREETELLATVALAAMYPLRRASPRIVDVCCGAGNLAITLAYNLPSAMVWATDLLERAALATRDNAHLHRLTDRVTAVCGDLFAPLADAALEGAVDLVVCNPPYLSTKRLESEREGLLKHEPPRVRRGTVRALDAPAIDRGGRSVSFAGRMAHGRVRGGASTAGYGIVATQGPLHKHPNASVTASGVARVAVARRKA